MGIGTLWVSSPAGVQLCARVPHVEDEWKVPLISYRREEVEVVGRGSLGLPVLRLPRHPHHSSVGLVFPPKFRPEGKQGFGSVFMCNGSGSSILG